MFSPKGTIVRTMRLRDVTTDADGTERVKLLSGGGVIVEVRPDATSRRKFAQFCDRHGLVAEAVERSSGADGTYNRRTGAVMGPGADKPADYRADPTVTAWQVIGPGPALSALVGMDADGRRTDPKPFVASWHFAVGVRPPMGAQGSGPEKVRPPMGSAFGRPAQVASTAAQLHADRQERLKVEMRAGRI